MNEYELPEEILEEDDREPAAFLYDTTEAERLKAKAKIIKDQSERIAELEEALEALLAGETG